MEALGAGLEEVLQRPDVKTARDAGVPRMSYEWGPSAETEIIARTIAVSLESLANTYPEYIKYEEISDDRGGL
jgi:uncharacterized protein YsxB (DUF464 family)